MSEENLLAFIFIFVGFLSIILPPNILLKFDRKTAYKIYQSALKKTKDRKQALSAAFWTYKALGTFFIMIGVFIYYIGTKGAN